MRFLKVFSLIIFPILLLLSNPIFAQTDPGVPDTVKFGEWKACVPCPPCSGRAIVPVEFFNDEDVIGFILLLKESQILDIDTLLFAEEYSEIISLWGLGIGDSSGNEDISNSFSVGAVSFNDSIPPIFESKTILHLYFAVIDTGIASLDSLRLKLPPGDVFTKFTLPSADEFVPQFLKTEYHITPTPQGDANLDGEVNLGDVIYLARYIFGKEPIIFDKCTPCEDINGDGNLDLSDVIELAHYILGH
ncbi:MAG: hypothetical protein AMJ90_09735 [candidate division Zixibacteria bacterium SM23_73_2]|nr:MAG: hypothetical protein AMJ90_09735 [candidate division Zixibacteria bacterium SM23_73_2]